MIKEIVLRQKIGGIVIFLSGFLIMIILITADIEEVVTIQDKIASGIIWAYLFDLLSKKTSIKIEK